MQLQQRSGVRRSGQALALVSIAALGVLGLMSSAAEASVLHFKGSASADAQTQISFDVSGHFGNVKQGKKTKRIFLASKVSNVSVENQLFTCYDATGSAVQEGRSTIPYDFNSIKPMTVAKSGKFSGVYEFLTSGHVVTRETFTGKITGRQAKGTFQAQYDPGGIEYGYCGNMTGEPYSAKG
ncbi:MAG: hypothetical protein H0X42_01625 [Solirubrobacterales bacterium]|nr:hypothetical protein [Solirubrobacterales bacterium]